VQASLLSWLPPLQEHLFLVCELLRANLYEFQKFNRESGDPPYFTLGRIQKIAHQVRGLLGVAEPVVLHVVVMTLCAAASTHRMFYYQQLLVM
jgi:hypothetical protein